MKTDLKEVLIASMLLLIALVMLWVQAWVIHNTDDGTVQLIVLTTFIATTFYGLAMLALVLHQVVEYIAYNK